MKTCITFLQKRARQFSRLSLLLCLGLLLSAQATLAQYSISNVSLSPSSPATLFSGENVNVTFNYTKGAGDVRIFARPMFAGSLASSYAAHGSPLYTAAAGSGSGFFTLSVPGNVDQIRFQIINALTNAVLYETFTNVNYRFLDYSISNVVLSPASPATLATGNNVNLTFNYRAKGGNVRIFARPMFAGSLASSYAAHGSSIYASPTGSGNGFFTLTVPGNADQVRFQIIDATTNAVLHEAFVNVNYSFVNYAISQVVMSPASPASLTTGENINLTFNYIAKGGNVRIFARPMRAGALAPGYAAHGSPLYASSTGSGTGFFTLNSAGTVDQVRFQIIDATTNSVLYQTFVAVNYRFINYEISNLVKTPASPATLTTGEHVNLTFNYRAKGGNVRIFARPMRAGALAPAYAAHGSPLYASPTGSGNGFFTLSVAGNVDQIRFQIVDATTNAVLYTKYFSVNYNFIDYDILNVVNTPVSPATLTSGDHVNISFNYKAKGGNVRIFARPMKAGALASVYAAHGSPLYTAATGSGTGFFTLSVSGNVDQVRFQIIDATTNAVLYTELFAVNYTFIDYDILNVIRTPLSGTMTTGENVNLTFNYKAKGGNVRIFARPMTAGALSPGYAAHGSPLYAASTGSGTGFFTLTVPNSVNQIRFQIIDATTNAVLYTEFVTVSYKFVDYLISNTVFTPASPDTLTTGSNINVTFKYNAKGGNVRIFARPMTGSVLSPGYAAHPSPLYSATSGNGNGFFTLTIPGTVTKVRFQIIDNVTNAVLYTRTVTVNYLFESAPARLFGEEESVNLSAVEISPVPANDYLNIHHTQADNFSYQLYNSNGILVNEGKADSAELQLDVQSYAPGMYLLLIINGKEVTEKKIIVQ